MVEFVVSSAPRPAVAVVSSQGHDVAKIRPEGDETFLLTMPGGSFKMDHRVGGEIRPFSMTVTPSSGVGESVLTIRNHLFFHREKAYFLTGIPEEVRPADHLIGRRHVNRLDTFPFSSLEDIDPETWGRLRRHRGVSVGTVDWTEPGDYKVTISEELEDVGVPLAAALFLLYTAG